MEYIMYSPYVVSHFYMIWEVIPSPWSTHTLLTIIPNLVYFPSTSNTFSSPLSSQIRWYQFVLSREKEKKLSYVNFHISTIANIPTHFCVHFSHHWELAFLMCFVSFLQLHENHVWTTIPFPSYIFNFSSSTGFFLLTFILSQIAELKQLETSLDPLTWYHPPAINFSSPLLYNFSSCLSSLFLFSLSHYSLTSLQFGLHPSHAT